MTDHRVWPLEDEVLAMLAVDEGVESFNLAVGAERIYQVRAALQRLRHKGLAEPVKCLDGTWVWFAVED